MSKPNAPQHMTTEEKKEALTQCLLSQYRLCAAGVVGGGAFSVIRASKVKATAWPMLGGGFFGTFADFVCKFFNQGFICDLIYIMLTHTIFRWLFRRVCSFEK
jgi:hypothetical protein